MTLRLAALITALLAASTVQAADNWPQFLGPNRNGISTGSGLLDSWPAGGPKEVWRVGGGVGMSGMAISGSHLCTLVQHDGQQWLLAIDPQTGQQQWQTAVVPEYRNAEGDGPRGPPYVTVGRVL